MKKLLAIVATVAAVAAYSDDFAAPQEKSCLAPDGVNVITERTDGTGGKTYSTTLAHVCDCGPVNCGVMTNDQSKAKRQNVIEQKVPSLRYEVEELKRTVYQLAFYCSDTRCKCASSGRQAVMCGGNAKIDLCELAKRLDALEKAEAERQKKSAEFKARREKAKAEREAKKDARQTLQEAIRRGRRVEKKEAK